MTDDVVDAVDTTTPIEPEPPIESATDEELDSAVDVPVDQPVEAGETPPEPGPSGPKTVGRLVADALRTAGLDDQTIFDATVFVAFRLAFATVNDALGAQPDRQVAEEAPPPLRAVVTFGRAVAEQPSTAAARG